MTNIHCLTMLPEQSVINNVAKVNQDFTKKDVNYVELLKKLKRVVISNRFLLEQDNSVWARTRGCDYLYNPKLFAYAPLTHVCAFISELCKHHEPERIKRRCPEPVLRHALSRLNHFKG